MFCCPPVDSISEEYSLLAISASGERSTLPYPSWTSRFSAWTRGQMGHRSMTNMRMTLSSNAKYLEISYLKISFCCFALTPQNVATTIETVAHPCLIVVPRTLGPSFCLCFGMSGPMTIILVVSCLRKKKEHQNTNGANK